MDDLADFDHFALRFKRWTLIRTFPKRSEFTIRPFRHPPLPRLDAVFVGTEIKLRVGYNYPCCVAQLAVSFSDAFNLLPIGKGEQDLGGGAGFVTTHGFFFLRHISQKMTLQMMVAAMHPAAHPQQKPLNQMAQFIIVQCAPELQSHMDQVVPGIAASALWSAKVFMIGSNRRRIVQRHPCTPTPCH